MPPNTAARTNAVNRPLQATWAPGGTRSPAIARPEGIDRAHPSLWLLPPSAREKSRREDEESPLPNRFVIQGIDFLENRLQTHLQLLLRAWFTLCFCELHVICNGPAIEVGSFI